MHDILFKDGEAILHGEGRAACDIAVRDGRIAAVASPGNGGGAKQEISVKGLVAFPGVIDAHLHLGHGKDISRPREPIDADRETAAAAREALPVSSRICWRPSRSRLFDDVRPSRKRARASTSAITSSSRPKISSPAFRAMRRDYGAPSFKIFMNNRGGEGTRLGLPDIDDGFLFRLCEAAAANGGMVCPHPETIEIAWVLRERLMDADPEGKGAGGLEWNAPAFCGSGCGAARWAVGTKAGAPLYIVHTSSEQAIVRLS